MSQSFFEGTSTLLVVENESVREWTRVKGNLNGIAWHPKRERWYAVSSSKNEVIELTPEGRPKLVAAMPRLEQGQDAVPGYLRVHPETGHLWVSLFSGSTVGERRGDGTEIAQRAGGVVSVDPVTGSVTWIVRGLTAPMDLEIGPDGTLYILEFCDAFLEPTKTRKDLDRENWHGGFRRYSGRLLRIGPDSRGVRVLARGLDTPSNLTLTAGHLYVSTGMGTPGRVIPGPRGPEPLDGRIVRIDLQ